MNHEPSCITNGTSRTPPHRCEWLVHLPTQLARVQQKGCSSGSYTRVALFTWETNITLSKQASKRAKGLWVHGWKLSASPRTYGAPPIYVNRAECATAARSICDMVSTQRRQIERLLGKPIKQATHSVRVYKAWGQFANIKKDHYSSH
jgi:hypothetical protein